MVTADLLLAFDEENKVHWKVSVLAHRGGHALYVGENLALVVGGAPGKKHIIADLGFERGGGPGRERFLGLDVVVTVDQDRGAVRPMDIPGEYHRMARGGGHLGGEADVL